MEERLQKLISAAGIASRREAEAMINAGRVSVNGKTAELGQRADMEKDEILVDGSPLNAPDRLVYILLNKPRGCVSTLKDEKDRQTVADMVRDCGARVYPVGRLDANSEGLLILTNDGSLTNALTHPSHSVEKVYTVRVAGENFDAAAEKLRGTLELEDGPAKAKRVSLISVEKDRAILEIVVTEGRKHLVRNLCAAVGLEVKRLIRVSEGGLTIDGVRTGHWRYLTEKEVLALYRAAGLPKPENTKRINLLKSETDGDKMNRKPGGGQKRGGQNFNPRSRRA